MGRRGDTTMESLERGRTELLGTTFLVLLAFAVTTVVLSFTGLGTDWFDDFGGTFTAVRVSVLVLAGGFALYAVDRERRFRAMLRALVNERVMTAALDSRLRQILSLTEAGRRVVTALELEDILEMVLDAAFELMGADEGSVMLRDDDDLVVAAVRGHDELIVGQRVPYGTGISGTVAASGRAVLIGGEDAKEQALRRTEEISSAMCVPLRLEGETIGVLSLNVTTGDRRYDEHDLRSLAFFADHVAAGVRNARVLRRERLRSEVVTTAVHDLEASLSTILGTVDALTRGDGPLGEDDHREALQAIARRAQGLVVAADRVLRTPAPRPTVPRTPGDESRPTPGRTLPRAPSRRLRVLVADEDPAMLRLLQVALERRGHEVLLASDGQTAVKRALTERADVVLHELVLPVRDGWGVLQDLRALPAPPPAIVLSVKGGVRDRVRALELGADGFVTKPADMDALVAKIEDLAARSPQEREAGRRETMRELSTPV